MNTRVHRRVQAVATEVERLYPRHDHAPMIGPTEGVPMNGLVGFVAAIVAAIALIIAARRRDARLHR